MEELYGWARNITGYFLFLAVMDNLIPGKKYEKYIRLFTGMVAVLLILQPLTGRIRLEERLAYFYETLVFQYQSEDLKGDILGMEKQRMKQMVEQYEAMVATDVGEMAEQMGFEVRECRVKIGSEEGTSRFGRVERVQMEISLKREEETGEENESAGMGEWSMAEIDPIVVGGETERGEEVSQERQQGEENLAVGKLQREIVSYYDLEEAYVEIRVVER